MAMAKSYVENNEYNSPDNAIISQQQQQQQQLQRQHHQQQQQLQTGQQFDAFDVANLRRLQQINEYYAKNNKNIDNSSHNDDADYNELQQQEQVQQEQQQQSEQQRVDQYNGNGKNNENYSSQLKKYSTGSVNDKSNKNNIGVLSSHQDARNNFRLQLSDLNEPAVGGGVDDARGGVSNNMFYTSSHIGNSAKRSNNKYLDHDNNRHFDTGNEGAATAGTDDANTGHSVSVRSKSFSGDQNTLDEVEESRENVEDELGMNLPYGIQNVRKRMVNGGPNAEHRSKSTTYQSLCPTKRVSIPLETAAFEYRPNHYVEVTCAHNYAPARNYDLDKNKICSEAGFSCIQLNRTIHLIRHSKASTVECWESEIRIVPSGCECMWPKHNYGDIIAYHDSQKRYNAQMHNRPMSDFQAGDNEEDGFRRTELLGFDGRRRVDLDGVGFDALDYEVN